MKKIYHLTILAACCLLLAFPSLGQVQSLPYVNDFEGSVQGWTTGGTGSQWELGTPGFGLTNSAFSGTQCWDISLLTGYANNTDAYLYTPQFDFTGTIVSTLSFWQNKNCELNWDGTYVEYSTDGTTWHILGNDTSNNSFSNNWYNTVRLISSNPPIPAFTGNSNGNWIESTHELSFLSNEPNVGFRFVFHSDASVVGDGFSIDNFRIATLDNNLIRGKLFVDANTNGIFDAGDQAIANQMVTAAPGSFIATTNANGDYSIIVDTGAATYTVTTTALLYHTANPAQHVVNFTSSQQTSASNDFAMSPIPNINDLAIIISTAPTRPGFDATYHITYRNIGTTTLSGNIDLVFDPNQTYTSSSATPSSQTGNMVSWPYNNLAPGTSGSFSVTLQLSASVAIGATISMTATINPIAADSNAINNVYGTEITVVGSFDPNDKIAQHGEEFSMQQLADNEFFYYTINFQNTGNFPATFVRVEDIISPLLDLATLQVLANSHPFSTLITADRKVSFFFNNINLIDSATNEAASKGFITFKIKPLNSIIPGNQVFNTASIFFDFNAPIVTNTTVTNIIYPSGIESNLSSVAQLFPNPTLGQIQVSLKDEPVQPIQLNIYNILGAQVYSQRLILRNTL
ncbi:MAG: hypothetical protein RIQ89_320, partial [Bacteroidota bacterium]